MSRARRAAGTNVTVHNVGNPGRGMTLRVNTSNRIKWGLPVRKTRGLIRLAVLGLSLLAATTATAACTGSGNGPQTPGLAPHDEIMTTTKPTRQDLTNRVSLAGKVSLNPVFGIVSPIGGQVRYLNVTAPTATPTKPTKVAGVWLNGKSTTVEVPAGAVFAGRLVDDRSTVTAGVPIVSAKHVGYGIVADIDAGQAYQLSDSLATVQAQIRNGPGPFACSVLGTIAALPAGSIPDPPAANPSPQPGASAVVVRPPMGSTNERTTPSEPTGMRLVCTAPADVKLINGATATLEVITEKVANVLVLPIEAVAGGQGKGKVDVVGPDGSRRTTDVVLGLTDGKVIEIRSGLTGTETVAVPGPNLPPADPKDNDGGGPGGLK